MTSTLTETHILQQIIIANSMSHFLKEVNGLLLQGWTVVPQTFAHTSVRQVPGPRVPDQYIGRAGEHWERSFFVVIQRTEVVDRDAAKRAIEAAKVEWDADQNAQAATSPHGGIRGF